MNPRIYPAIFMVGSLLFLFLGCGQNSPDYENSMSPKEFLYETNYILVIDGKKYTKYIDGNLQVNCSRESIIELLDENGKRISELFFKPKENLDIWVSFPNTSIQIKAFTKF